MSVLQNKAADSFYGLDAGCMHVPPHCATSFRRNIESLSSLLELLSCPELHSILRLVLKAGNYMNAVRALFFFFSCLTALFSMYNGGLSLCVCAQRRHSAPGFCIIVCLKLSHVVCVILTLYVTLSGRICGERCRFPNFIAAQTG